MKIKVLLFVFACGFILNLANTNLLIVVICIGLAPLFIVFHNNSKKASLSVGLVYGIGIGIGMFFWMIKGISHYTGNSFYYGIFVGLASCLFLGLYFAFLSWITKLCWISNSASKWLLISNRICIAAIWTISELGLAELLKSFPLHYFRIGFPFVKNIYTIQLASFGGLSLLTFLTVLINLFTADSYVYKKIKYLAYSVSIIIVMFVIGSVSFYSFKPQLTGKPFKVAIVSDNTNPETKWNKENGNAFAYKYFQLCKDAVALNPDFIIWPETALPWTYSTDDDLLNEIIKISNTKKLTHVIGINHENSQDKKLYNSVFYINNQNQVTGIYNKQILLKGIEEPLGSFVVPFLSQEGFVMSRGKSQLPIKTSFGKAGNLICNEVVVENCAANQVKAGSNFLFNLSNDGWFKDNYISDLHFYYARLQAVENRKDISIANNCGFNAIISSNGSIISQKKGAMPTVVSGTIYPNNNKTPFINLPYLFPIFLLLFISSYFIFINLKLPKNMP